MEGWKPIKPIGLYKLSVKLSIKTGEVILEVNNLLFAVLAVMLLTGYAGKFLITFFLMLLHESGHAAAAIMMGKKVNTIKFLPVGLNVSIEERTCSRWESIVIYSSGPLTNILLFASGWMLYRHTLFYWENMQFFILLNFYLAAFNMIPVLPLDGGKLLREAMALRVGLFHANRYVINTTIVVSFLIILLGVVQLFNRLHNFSLFIIGFYIFFSLKSEKVEVALMNIKNIVYRRSRILKKGIYGARDLVVLESKCLGDALKSMDFDRFHFIHVLDDDLKLVKVITEQELMDGMLKYSAETTFEEFIRGKEK